MIKNLRDFKSANERREYLESVFNISLKTSGSFSFAEDEVLGKNIENLIGVSQIPLGVAGPIRIIGSRNESYFIPLATTEGALVASVSRGCKAISESGGAVVLAEDVGMTRGPVFVSKGIKHSKDSIDWVEKNFDLIAGVTKKTSSHLKLKHIDPTFVGKNVFIRFVYETGDAMGMNMVTIATEKAVQTIEEGTNLVCTSVAGNYDIDKKPAWLNFIKGRGKRVWAEATIKKEIVESVLKTTPEKIADLVYRKNHLGSTLSGAMGFNAHFANILAAIFIATGQDPAHVVEGSMGITTAEVLKGSNLYFSIYLPALVVGTVGGGTHLPTQKEALSIISGEPKLDVLEFAKVIGASVLSGELSLISSQAEGSLAKAHMRLGRKK
jgi:hydroxymethylglutaryl-CoA reductase (NADPH)